MTHLTSLFFTLVLIFFGFFLPVRFSWLFSCLMLYNPCRDRGNFKTNSWKVAEPSYQGVVHWLHLCAQEVAISFQTVCSWVGIIWGSCLWLNLKTCRNTHHDKQNQRKFEIRTFLLVVQLKIWFSTRKHSPFLSPLWTFSLRSVSSWECVIVSNNWKLRKRYFVNVST